MPRLWEDETVTNQERKEILRCVINHIVIAATDERIDATIVWKSGSKTPLTIWRYLGRHNLIRELHAQNLTSFEIREHLAAGKTSTGQVVNISLGRLRLMMHKLGLQPNRISSSYLWLRQQAAELYREGRSIESIARYFNEQKFPSASGKLWTRTMVFNLHRVNGEKAESYESLHRRAITDAQARGLSYEQMAVEFNKRGIRRRGGGPWTAVNVGQRWTELNRRKSIRQRKKSGTAKPSDLVVLKRSA